ncbi:hypothetical protein Pelo_3735 [Pelomyxa schiedti]|nr:hypothetical protein Pelo_3735 [Pelomyxa schiedti]
MMIESYVVVPVPAGDRSNENATAPNGVTAAPVPKYGYYPSGDEARPLLPALLPTENAAPDAQKKVVHAVFLGGLLWSSIVSGLLSIWVLILGSTFVLEGCFLYMKGRNTLGLILFGVIILVNGSVPHCLCRAIMLLWCSVVLMILLIRKTSFHWVWWLLFGLGFIVAAAMVVCRIVALQWIYWSHILLSCAALPITFLSVFLCDHMMDSMLLALHNNPLHTGIVMTVLCSLTSLVISLYI